MRKKSVRTEQNPRIALKRVAYHEAGHAVMAFWLRCRFHHVSIILDESEDTVGHVLSGKRARVEYERVEPSSHNRFQIEKYILVALGGNAAERLLTGRKVWAGSETDLHNAYDYVSLLIQEENEIRAYLKWLHERTGNTLSSACNWFAVETLANELLNRRYIGSGQVHQIIRKAWKDSVEHVPRRQQNEK
ncbi:hypothetical protein ACFLV4_01245 [Chloroflexota bacterium]